MADTADDRCTAPRLSVFNHKGGVGKTTLTVNIADALARKKKRVLLVDSDPQCNLTSYLVEENVVNDWLDASETENGVTVWSALKPVIEATGGVELIEPYERLTNVWLVPGDIRLSQFEQDLSQMWGECLQRKTRGFRGTSALSYLVNRLCKKYAIDYVFYDCGPNIGPLNKAILLDCDYYIVPAACDLFSIRALKTLGQTLGAWINEWRTVSGLAPRNLYMLPGEPRFLGYIPQRFKIYRGLVAKGYSPYLSRIDKTVSSDIVSFLRKIDPSLIAAPTGQYKLGQIKDFGSLANESQIQGVPLSSVNAGTSDQREAAVESFAGIAKRIIELTEG